MEKEVWKEHVFTDEQKQKYAEQLSLEIAVDKLRSKKEKMEGLIKEYMSHHTYLNHIKDINTVTNKKFIKELKDKMSVIEARLDVIADEARKQEIIVMGKYYEVNNLKDMPGEDINIKSANKIKKLKEKLMNTIT